MTALNNISPTHSMGEKALMREIISQQARNKAVPPRPGPQGTCSLRESLICLGDVRFQAKRDPRIVLADVRLAAPQGFEPRYADPESAVLPLNEGAVASLSNEPEWRSNMKVGIRFSRSQEQTPCAKSGLSE